MWRRGTEIHVLCDRRSQFTAEWFLERKVSEHFPTARKMGKRGDPTVFILLGHVDLIH
jgi:transposase